MKIRKFRIEDAEDVSKVIRDSISTGDLTDEAVKTLKRRANPRTLIRTSGTTDYYVYEDNGDILGIGGRFKNEVRTMYVSPRFQRKGIGSKILMEIVNSGRTKGYRLLFLYTHPTAEKFYLNNGFVSIRKFKDGEMNVVYMEKEIK